MRRAVLPPLVCGSGGSTRVIPAQAEFFGGPADGEIRDVLTDEWGMPALHQLAWGAAVHYASGAPAHPSLGSVEPLLYSYRRKVSPRDDGPLWWYVLEEQI